MSRSRFNKKIFSVMNQLPVAEHGPKVVVACPPGETHELGAQAVAYRCRVRGCRVYYLGANVPLEALTKLCIEVHPALTLISIPSVMRDEEVSDLAHAIATQIKSHCDVVVGGDGAVAAKELFQKESIDVIESFPELDELLRELLLQRATRLQE